MTSEAGLPVDLFSRNLGRGKACELCRRRKLRCDGVRPVCSRCQEARTRRLNRMRAKGLSEDQINTIIFPPCFDEGDDDQRSRADGGTGSVAGGSTSSPDGHDQRSAKHQRVAQKVENDNGTQNDLFFAEILSSQLPVDATTTSTASGGSVPHYNPTANATTSAPHPALIYYNHSSMMEKLPEPEKIVALLEVAFECYPTYTVFQPERLLERLAKGPEDEDYPHFSALHVMLAIAYTQRPDLDSSLEKSSPPSARRGAHYRHTLAAQQAIFDATHNGGDSRSFFDVTRAILLLCFLQYGMGDVFESYLSNTSAIRGCVGLNMNREVARVAVGQEAILQQTLLPRIANTSMISFEPKDAIEEEEVRRTMMVAFAADRLCCATTLWPCTLPDEDYTTSLPRATLKEFVEGSFGDQVMSRSPFYLASPDFFSRAPVDAVEMLLKGLVILGKCAELVSRLPRDATKDYISALPAFQRLQSQMTTFQLNTTTLANSYGGRSTNSVGALNAWLTSKSVPHMYDASLIGVTSIPHACTLTLHEPFASLSEESEVLCRGACRSVIEILRIVSVNAEMHLDRLDIIFVLVFTLVGRSLIRQLESLYSKLIAHEFTQSGPNSAWDSKEFTDSVSLLQADLEVILLTLRRLGRRWPIGMRQHDALLKLLQFNPEHRLRGLFCVS